MHYVGGSAWWWCIQIHTVAFPEALDAYLGYMRVRITEELAWLCGSPLYTIMAEGGGGSAEPGGTVLLEVCRVYRLFSSACCTPSAIGPNLVAGCFVVQHSTQ